TYFFMFYLLKKPNKPVTPQPPSWLWGFFMTMHDQYEPLFFANSKPSKLAFSYLAPLPFYLQRVDRHHSEPLYTLDK
ncbi:MAG: hypothetical protein OES29_09425, partial [Desulfuromonadales bacterium]|nr:hypothetical protein [Desulfuromonadales bacterium]